MTYDVIATGSTGNAVLINDSILIDIGVPWKKIQPYAKQIRLVLLTHIHGDHFQPTTVRALHRERPAVRWACCEWMVRPLLDAGVDKRAIHVYDLCKTYFYSSDAITCGVMAEEIPHNAKNCCYHIFMDGEKIFYATDCSGLNMITARDYSMYMVESNHRRAEIEERIAAKQAAGEFAYEMEACRNHLSYEQAMDWLAANAGPESRYILLHQHMDKEVSNERACGKNKSVHRENQSF